MGMIYENFGRFAVEGRRESFYVHASYGLKPLELALGELALGQRFREVGSEEVKWVVGHLIDGVTLVMPWPEDLGDRELMSSQVVVVPLDDDGSPVDQVDDYHPLGRTWREHPHPEFDNDDLDDLIAALSDYRSKLEGS